MRQKDVEFCHRLPTHPWWGFQVWDLQAFLFLPLSLQTFSAFSLQLRFLLPGRLREPDKLNRKKRFRRWGPWVFPVSWTDKRFTSQRECVSPFALHIGRSRRIP